MGKLHGGNNLRGLCYRRNYSEAIVCRAKVLGVIVLAGSFIGGNSLWVRSLGVNFPLGDFMGVIVQGVIVLGGIAPGQFSMEELFRGDCLGGKSLGEIVHGRLSGDI